MEEEIKRFFENYTKNSVPLPKFITCQFTKKTRFNDRGSIGEIICPECQDGYSGEEFIVDKNEDRGLWELLPTKKGVNGYVYLIGEWIQIKTK